MYDSYIPWQQDCTASPSLLHFEQSSQGSPAGQKSTCGKLVLFFAVLPNTQGCSVCYSYVPFFNSRSLNELRVLLLESHRHSRDMEKDLNREVHKAEWKVKEQKLQDDIKTLREKLLLLVRKTNFVMISSCCFWGELQQFIIINFSDIYSFFPVLEMLFNASVM